MVLIRHSTTDSSVVIVRESGRSSNHRTWVEARFGSESPFHGLLDARFRGHDGGEIVWMDFGEERQP
jgi:hypothetical protein